MIRSATVTLVLAFVTLSSCRSQFESQVARIASSRDSIRAAVLRSDAATIASYFGSAATLQPPDAIEVPGRDSIESLFVGIFRQAKITEYEIRPDTVLISGASAVEMGTYTERVEPTAGEAIILHGRYAFLWLRESDGIWRVRRLLYNHGPPRP